MKTYAHTPQGTAISGNPTKTDSFTFGNTAHPDRLTKFGSKSITYNAVGCPTAYDGKTFTWSKGKLGSITKGSLKVFTSPYETYSYTYNALGQRTAKRYTYRPANNFASMGSYLSNTNTTYTYDNSGRLIREARTYSYSDSTSYALEFIFLYDESGMIGVQFKDGDAAPQLFYYQRNLQGDVVAIYNTAGVLQAKYRYDAWGNCTVTNSTNLHLATYNPIRYRGYYYDDETKWYFLNARYYSPEWRRFISPDDTAYLDPESVNGLNLYTYCNNDPVNFCDPSGHESKLWAWIFSGVLVTAGIVACAVATPGIFGLGIIGGVAIGMGAGSLINGYVTEANGGNFWGGYIGGAISGALCGVGAGFGGLAFVAATNSVGSLCLGYLSLGAVASFAGGFLGNFTGTLYTDWHNSGFNGVNLNINELLATSTIMGTLNIFAGLGSGISSIIGEMGKTAGISVNSQFAHRLLAGTVAGGTEAFYDTTSYLFGFWN